MSARLIVSERHYLWNILWKTDGRQTEKNQVSLVGLYSLINGMKTKAVSLHLPTNTSCMKSAALSTNQPITAKIPPRKISTNRSPPYHKGAFKHHTMDLYAIQLKGGIFWYYGLMADAALGSRVGIFYNSTNIIGHFRSKLQVPLSGC